MPSFTVALDLGKRKHAVSIYNSQTNELCHSTTIAVNQEGFTELHTALTSCSRQPADFMIGCEATGHYGDTVIRSLQKKKYKVVRMNPTQVTQFRRGLGRRAKTDALDADSMARQLAVGDFVPDHPLSNTALKLRRLTRLRLAFIEERGRWTNRMSAVINQMFPEVEPLLTGLNSPTTIAILTAYPSRKRLANASMKKLTRIIERASRRNKGEAYARTLKETAADSVGLDDPCLEMELSILLDQVSGKNQSIHEMDQQIKMTTQQLLAERSQELDLEHQLGIKDFPLGDYLSIGTLLGELGCIERFPTQKQMLSYFGWCPNTKESGTQKSPHPRMSHQGNRFARRIIWMLSVSAIRWVPEYRDYYQRRIAAGHNKMKTLVAVGRKLLCVMRSILISGQPYDPNRYLSKQQVVLAN